LEVEIVFDAKFYSLRNLTSVGKYFALLTCLKIRKFVICFEDIIWDNKWAFGSKGASIVKAIPRNKKCDYEIMNTMNNEDLNIHSIMLRNENNFRGLTCPRNLTLGRAIAM
jgi:hypothetical protein